jgi:3-oxoacyl-[acyl-carrier-protein] synthase III
MVRIAQIVSTARYLPPHLVSNAELTERFTALGRPHVIDKLAASTGISKRFYDWVTSDLALMAAQEALKRAGRGAEDIDLIILGTTSPDYITPASSVVLQHKLGAKNAGAFDVDCACAAFPALVAIGAGLISTNPAMKTVLLVGVDMIHRLTDKNDAGSFFWSAGAGAAVLEGGNAAGFIGAAFQADGAFAAGWGIIAGGTFEPANVDAVKDHRTMMRREAGNYPASVNEDNWPRLFRRACPANADSLRMKWIN